jgi:hypothetical protein
MLISLCPCQAEARLHSWTRYVGICISRAWHAVVPVHVHARPALDVPGGLALGPVPGGRGARVLAERGGRACGLAARGDEPVQRAQRHAHGHGRQLAGARPSQRAMRMLSHLALRRLHSRARVRFLPWMLCSDFPSPGVRKAPRPRVPPRSSLRAPRAQRPASRLIRSALLVLLFVVSFQDGVERPELVQACRPRSCPRRLCKKVVFMQREDMTANSLLQCKLSWEAEHVERRGRYDDKHACAAAGQYTRPETRRATLGCRAQWAWNTVLKVLLCLVLFCGTDLLKTLAAKSLARTFHKDAHFAKMQDALEKARRADPRPRMRPNCAGADLFTSAGAELHRLAALRSASGRARALCTSMVFARPRDMCHTRCSAVGGGWLACRAPRPGVHPARAVAAAAAPGAGGGGRGAARAARRARRRGACGQHAARALRVARHVRRRPGAAHARPVQHAL